MPGSLTERGKLKRGEISRGEVGGGSQGERNETLATTVEKRLKNKHYGT